MVLEELNKVLFENNVLLGFHVDIEPFTFKYNLLLSLSKDETSEQKVSFYFYDVCNLTLKEIGGGLTQLMHLKITGLEGSNDRRKYIIEDLENNKLFFEFDSCDAF